MEYYYTNSSKKKISKWVDFLFPMSTYCICCGNFIDKKRSYSLCDSCIKKVSFDFYYIDLEKEERLTNEKIFLDSMYVASPYNRYSKEMVLSLKYKKKTYISRILSNVLVDRVLNDEILSEKVLNSDMVIPVPISKDKLESRGFNQTEKIGKYFCKRLGLNLITGIERVVNTIPQKEIKGTLRRENISNSFKLNIDVKGKVILLLDDIYTTGSTLKEISKVLKENGAKEVIGLAVLSGNKYLKKENL